jgi:predicted nucleic acid-binding Zn ribbon protein
MTIQMTEAPGAVFKGKGTYDSDKRVRNVSNHYGDEERAQVREMVAQAVKEHKR